MPPGSFPELVAAGPELAELAPDRNPAAVYLARLGPGSRSHMERSLRVTMNVLSAQVGRDPRRFPWWALRYQHTQAVRAVLAQRYAPGGANRHLAALRGVLKEAWRLGLMTAEDHARSADVESIRGNRLPAGRELSAGELRALFEACAAKGGSTGARDAALLTLLYGCGLRRTEAVSVDVTDYSADTGEVAVRSGKGGKDRLVYATSGGRAALDAWLGVRQREPGPLLCPVSKGGGRIELRRMTSHNVLHLVRKIARNARVVRFSPHDLRRTFVSNLLDAGADIATVKELAGHASIMTTARYDRRGERAKKKAAELLSVPYVAPRS
jgi:integrase/recombinase XerD